MKVSRQANADRLGKRSVAAKDDWLPSNQLYPAGLGQRIGPGLNRQSAAGEVLLIVQRVLQGRLHHARLGIASIGVVLGVEQDVRAARDQTDYRRYPA